MAQTRTREQLIEIQVREQLALLFSNARLDEPCLTRLEYNELINTVRLAERRLELVEKALADLDRVPA